VAELRVRGTRTPTHYNPSANRLKVEGLDGSKGAAPRSGSLLPLSPSSDTLGRMADPGESHGVEATEKVASPVRKLQLRLGLVGDAFSLLRELGLDKAKGDDFAQRLAALDPRVQRLATVSEEEFKKEHRGIEKAVEELRDKFLELDATVSMDVFRRRFIEAPRVPRSVARYAHLIASHSVKTVALRDRFEFLLTRRLAEAQQSGSLKPISRTESESAARAIVPRAPTLADSERKEIVERFKGYIAKVGALKSVEELFDTGLYAEVRADKQKLGDRLLEAHVLLTAVDYNLAFSNRLAAFAAAGQQPKTALALLFDQHRERADKIAAGVSVDPVSSKRPTDKKAKAYDSGRAAGLQVALGMFAILLSLGLLSFGAFWAGGGIERGPIPVDGTELRRLSTVLESGTYSRSEANREFIGKVKNAAWDAMPAPDRQTEAQQFTKRLLWGQVRAAKVYRDQAVVIEVQNGSLATR